MSTYYVLNATREWAQHQGTLESCRTYIRNASDLFNVVGLCIAERKAGKYVPLTTDLFGTVADRVADWDRELIIPTDNIGEDGFILNLGLACGHSIPNREGEPFWNYYDMHGDAISRPARTIDAAYDTSEILPHGITYWFRAEQSGSLDGSRAVCVDCALSKMRGET